MIKAIIVDDELSATEMIRELLSSAMPEIHISDVCLNIKDAIHSIYKHRPEIIFLDIELADGSGFEVLEGFSDLHSRVIFITAHEQYALRAIKHHAFDYILKPIMPDEFDNVVKQVIKEIKKSGAQPINTLQQYISLLPQKIAIPNRNGVDYYPLPDIVCIEGQGSYSVVHLTNNKELTVTRSMKDFETSLNDKGFLRVHKSYLVNIAHILAHKKEDNGYLVMSNKQEIPISAKDKDSILYTLRQQSNIIY